jgi:hypothetical protein
MGLKDSRGGEGLAERGPLDDRCMGLEDSKGGEGLAERGPLDGRGVGRKMLRSFRGFTKGGCSNGNSKLKMVPVPGSLVTWIFPPKLRTYRPMAVISTFKAPSVSSTLGVVSVVGRARYLLS